MERLTLGLLVVWACSTCTGGQRFLDVEGILGVSSAAGSLSLLMDDFIQAVKQVEDAEPQSVPRSVVKRLRRTARLNDTFVQSFLGDPSAAGPELDAALDDYIRTSVSYRVTEEAREEGVVLTADGSTVALRPLLLGLEAGLLPRYSERQRAVYQLTLARELGLSLRSAPPSGRRVGPDGCWDSLSSPRVFALSDTPSLPTASYVNGAMDGVLLGMAVKSRRPTKLSDLLTQYYSLGLDEGGMDAAPRLISRRRRDNFREQVLPPLLLRQVVKAVELQRSLGGEERMEVAQKRQLTAVLRRGLRDFVHTFMDCPPIIPRCMWEAAPYRGTPTDLSPPLTFMFIHHTAVPSRPCLTFQQCSADMRSMQRFHQEDRGWDDIGYSFVAGSDGYVYEGRGWRWQGAHTLGHNSVGYGVSFIGDYSSQLPSQHSMRLVRDQLASCAVGGDRLKPDFIVKGHRQVVNTSCPGDAFYHEIKSWQHFGENKK